MPVLFLCGCQGDEVGQHFANGVLVCPIHHEPTAPFDREAPPYRGVVRLEIQIETLDEKQAQRWLDTLAETLTLDATVINVLVTSEPT